MDDVDSVARSVDKVGAAPGDDGGSTPLPETVRISSPPFFFFFLISSACFGIAR